MSHNEHWKAIEQRVKLEGSSRGMTSHSKGSWIHIPVDPHLYMYKGAWKFPPKL